MRRPSQDEPEPFGLSLLDLLTCGLGAMCLLLVLSRDQQSRQDVLLQHRLKSAVAELHRTPRPVTDADIEHQALVEELEQKTLRKDSRLPASQPGMHHLDKARKALVLL